MVIDGLVADRAALFGKETAYLTMAESDSLCRGGGGVRLSRLYLVLGVKVLVEPSVVVPPSQ